ncbi:MAG: FkbM family methyltransferase [Rickettsiales bacterium]|jgi:FkbM family methyltransferase|nr:FkbM family methyltransferase [Rickettsiales bacterium]
MILDTSRSILERRGLVSDFNYLDIGANNPKFISNTYWLYKLGYSGVLVEPTKHLANRLSAERPWDVVLNVGITAEGDGTMPFYQFPPKADGLSSFSQAEADEALRKLAAMGKRLEYEVVQVETRRISDMLEKYFPAGKMFLCSIDVEGIDYDILKSFDFGRCRPVFFIVETAELTKAGFLGRKNNQCREFLEGRDYVLYADSYINTIMVDRNILEKMY